MNRIFLGGTCADTTWRDELIPMLEARGIDYFNPVVKNWTPECQAVEEDEKNNKCDVHLYVITPEMIGVYSIAEIINSCWQAQLYGPHANQVIFCVMGEWSKGQKKSFEATMRLCKDIAPDRSSTAFVKDTLEIMQAIYDAGIKGNKPMLSGNDIIRIQDLWYSGRATFQDIFNDINQFRDVKVTESEIEKYCKM